MQKATDTTELFRYMSDVTKYQTQLNSLDDAWEHIKRLAEVTCPAGAQTILSSMEKTQSEFKELQQKLIENLVKEQLRKSTLEISSKAQVAVDILIRNLFERSADVGFLATDSDLRAFLALSSPGETDLQFIQARLIDYVTKYTVYEEIILLDANGAVRAHLDPQNPIGQLSLTSGLFEQTLSSTAPFTETFGPSPLQPNKRNALIFSCKITASSEPDAKLLGVLCLCFKFEDELHGIFKSLRKEGDKSVMMILDCSGKVIASSDPHHIPLDTEMEVVLHDEYRFVEFGGREYLAKTQPTRGYQGYFGQGWQGHVMTPCEFAFRHPAHSSLEGIDPETVRRVMNLSRTISPVLTDIADRATLINLALRRVVWNGQVMNDESTDGASRLKAVLSQISKTGGKTIEVFSQSIENLHETVISSSLDDAKFLARLAIDIMDRNLYERSDDCRWWALTTDFRRLLAQDTLSEEDQQRISTILGHINGLYTVCSLLFYDRNGKIVAVSHPEQAHLVGQRLSQDFVQRTLQLHDSQKYTVSNFEETDLYGGNRTYIYGAPITAINAPLTTVGGIGIVFDSTPQFSAMLKDSLPPKPGSLGFFCDREGLIISSSDPSHPVGTILPLPESFFQLRNGEGTSSIVEYKNSFCVVGAMTSSGYREYKNSGDYTNDVIALILVPIGAAQIALDTALHNRSLTDSEPTGKPQGTCVELATFFVDGRRYALEKHVVLEAVSHEKMTNRIPGASAFLEGTLTFRQQIVPVLNLREIFKCSNDQIDPRAQIIVTRVGDGDSSLLGLLVDDLDAVPEIESTRVEDVPRLIAGNAGYTRKIVKKKHDDDLSDMIFVVDPLLLLNSGIKREQKDNPAPHPEETSVRAMNAEAGHKS